MKASAFIVQPSPALTSFKLVRRNGNLIFPTNNQDDTKPPNLAFGFFLFGAPPRVSEEKTVDERFSDGYDIASEAMCFLCDYMGQSLWTVLAVNSKGK